MEVSDTAGGVAHGVGTDTATPPLRARACTFCLHDPTPPAIAIARPSRRSACSSAQHGATSGRKFCFVRRKAVQLLLFPHHDLATVLNVHIVWAA